MQNGFELRPGNNGDIEAVTALVFSILRSYGLAPDQGATDGDLLDIERFYHQAGGCFDVLVATEHDEIIGTVGLHPLGLETVELRKMYLHPGYRGRGFGRLLLNHALEQARRKRFQRVYLETSTVLKEAIGLYQSAGFQPCSTDRLPPRCDLAMHLMML
jgi:putative acetyltransferase